MYKTSELLDDLYQKTENYLEKAVKEWQSKPNFHFTSQPKPDAWSAAQCLEHLNIYGRYYLPAIEKAIDKAEQNDWKPNENFKSGWLGDYFYRQMLPSTEGVLKMKMKSPKNAVPSPQPNAPKMIAEFIDQQERLLQLIEKARNVDIGRVRVPISLTKYIKLKLGDVFLFLIAHNYRHILQAERAMQMSFTKEMA